MSLCVTLYKCLEENHSVPKWKVNLGILKTLKRSDKKKYIAYVYLKFAKRFRLFIVRSGFSFTVFYCKFTWTFFQKSEVCNLAVKKLGIKSILLYGFQCPKNSLLETHKNSFFLTINFICHFSVRSEY